MNELFTCEHPFSGLKVMVIMHKISNNEHPLLVTHNQINENISSEEFSEPSGDASCDEVINLINNTWNFVSFNRPMMKDVRSKLKSLYLNHSKNNNNNPSMRIEPSPNKKLSVNFVYNFNKSYQSMATDTANSVSTKRSLESLTINEIYDIFITRLNFIECEKVFVELKLNGYHIKSIETMNDYYDLNINNMCNLKIKSFLNIINQFKLDGIPEWLLQVSSLIC